MYGLYDMFTIKLITEEETEGELFPAIENRVKTNPYMYLLVVRDNTEIITGLRSEQDYINYRKEYEYRTLTSKSCFELKKEILELKEKAKVNRKILG